ncbi:MAG: site-specific DNA-methyltransferase [Dissulfurispiraceae bacterium]
MAKKNKYADWSREDLIKRIEALDKPKKYGLVWDEERTKEKFDAEAEGKFPVLKDIKSKEIKTDPHKQTHILIEGDNYHALSVLNYTHEKAIDVIYIDPPYNTGNNSWKYNNRYVNEDDSYKHSKYLSFMEKRLSLVKNLLSPTGIICVTIDNYEVHTLRFLMEDILTDRDIVMTVIEHNFRGRVKRNFALTHEYALWGIPKGQDLITKQREKAKDIQRNLRRTGQGSRRHESPTMFYGIEVDKQTMHILGVTDALKLDEEIPQHSKPETEMVYPIDDEGVQRRWYYGRITVMDEAKKGHVWAKRIKGNIQIHYWKPGKEKRRKSVWTSPKYDGSTYGTELLTSIIGQNDFPFPKSIYAVKECIEACTYKKDAVILDFFAGSGTTGHAVLELNKEDSGTRQFIVVTNNENQICEQICYPRLSRVIQGHEFQGTERELLFENEISLSDLKNTYEILATVDHAKVKNQNAFDEFKTEFENNTLRLWGIRKNSGWKEGLGGNLKYYRTSFVPQEPTDRNKDLLTKEATEMLCLRENTFDLVSETATFKLFKNSDHYTGIIFDQLSIPKFKKFVSKCDGKISVYVFSLGDDDFSDEFDDIRNTVKVCSIPEAILRVYRRIFK